MKKLSVKLKRMKFLNTRVQISNKALLFIAVAVWAQCYVIMGSFYQYRIVYDKIYSEVNYVINAVNKIRSTPAPGSSVSNEDSISSKREEQARKAVERLSENIKTDNYSFIYYYQPSLDPYSSGNGFSDLKIYVSDNNYLSTDTDYYNVEQVHSYYSKGHYYENPKEWVTDSESSLFKYAEYAVLKNLGKIEKYDLKDYVTENNDYYPYHKYTMDYMFERIHLNIINSMFPEYPDYYYAFVRQTSDYQYCIRPDSQEFLSEIYKDTLNCDYAFYFFDIDYNLKYYADFSSNRSIIVKYDIFKNNLNSLKEFKDFPLDLTAQDHCDGKETKLIKLGLSISCPVNINISNNNRSVSGFFDNDLAILSSDTARLDIIDSQYSADQLNIPVAFADYFTYEWDYGKMEKVTKLNSVNRSIMINGANFKYDVYQQKFSYDEYYDDSIKNYRNIPVYYPRILTFYVLTGEIGSREYIIVITMEDIEKVTSGGKIVKEPQDPAGFAAMEDVLRSIRPLPQ
jgi:hypothetical protein